MSKRSIFAGILLAVLMVVTACPAPTPVVAPVTPFSAVTTPPPPPAAPPSPAATVVPPTRAPVTPPAATPKPAPVASNIQVLDSSAETDFPKTITFKVRAESTVNITRITLSYNVDKITVAPVINEVRVNFTPSPKAEAQWVWDQRKGGPPGGTQITYQWIIEDANGSRLRTESKRFVYQDPHFDKTTPLTEGMVTLYWYNADSNYGQTLMDAAQEALRTLARDTGAQLERAVKLYVYPSYSELRSALVFPQEWTGGVAFTEYGIIAIGVPTNRAGVEYGKRTVAHELGHLVTFQMTFNPYGVSMPPWLNEGLSKYGEGATETELKGRLENAIKNNKLFSVKSLSSSFSADSDEALLSYAQSESFVRFLIGKYGRESMLKYLGLFKQGVPAEEGLKQVYGLDYGSLDAAWRAYVGARPQATALAKPSAQAAIASVSPLSASSWRLLKPFSPLSARVRLAKPSPAIQTLLAREV